MNFCISNVLCHYVTYSCQCISNMYMNFKLVCVNGGIFYRIWFKFQYVRFKTIQGRYRKEKKALRIGLETCQHLASGLYARKVLFYICSKTNILCITKVILIYIYILKILMSILKFKITNVPMMTSNGWLQIKSSRAIFCMPQMCFPIIHFRIIYVKNYFITPILLCDFYWYHRNIYLN